ncbi:MAG: hypothetical protein ABW292_07340 [Vicinamibacterales bacterium]
MWKASWKSVAALALVAAAYCGAHAHAQADAKATAVIANVRKALGGEQKIAGMKGLSLRADYRRELSAGASGGGTMTVVMMGGGSAGGSQQTNGKIEIDLALPDKYLRSDIGSAAFGMTRTEGFDATRPFLEVVPNSPGMRIQTDNPASDPARAKLALQRSQSDLARLFLGLTGGTQPGFTATYAYGGQAESPDGKADIIDVTGPGDFKVRMYVDVETHLPLMLTYIEPEPRMVMRTMSGDGGRGGSATAVAPPGVASHGSGAPAAGPPADSPQSAGGRQSGTPAIAGLSPAEREALDKQIKDAEATPPKLVEYRLFFSDYRKVDGVSLPHRIARGLGAKTIEEWDITSYQVNPSFKADRFNVGR